MKARILLCVALGSSLMLGCSLVPNVGDIFSDISSEIISTGSGNVVTEEFDLTGFDKVDASYGFSVSISQGDTFGVEVSIDDNLVEYLRVEKQGSTLKIGLAPGRDYIGTGATAEVTMPELTGLELSGGTRGTVSGFKSSRGLTVDVSGGSRLSGDIEAGDARFDVSGGSRVTLSGSAEDGMIDAAGASRVDLADFPVGDANVEASGASKVTVNASGRLDADASGASEITYLGSPALGTIDSSSGSSVEPE